MRFNQWYYRTHNLTSWLQHEGEWNGWNIVECPKKKKRWMHSNRELNTNVLLSNLGKKLHTEKRQYEGNTQITEDERWRARITEEALVGDRADILAKAPRWRRPWRQIWGKLPPCAAGAAVPALSGCEPEEAQGWAFNTAHGSEPLMRYVIYDLWL